MTALHRNAAALGAAAALSLVLASCADEPASTSSAPEPEPSVAESTEAGSGEPPTSAEQVEGPFNDTDIAFAQGMIPHHRQAVEMADLAEGRTDTPEVLALAGEISAAQGPEIETMTGYLDAWGAEVPPEMDGMDMGGGDGMMSDEDMVSLETAEGDEFDRLFLESMVVHHEGAVEMAQREVDNGENPLAMATAQEIVDAQESEIQRMQDLLGDA